MKVLTTVDGPHALGEQFMAMSRVLQYCGHEVLIAPVTANPFDVLRFNPDLILGQTYNLSDDWVRAIQQTNSKCVMRAFDSGAIEQEAKKKTELTGIDYKIEFAKDLHKKWAEQLYKSGHLSFVYNHYHKDDLEFLMSGWDNICPVKSNMLAACLFTYLGGVHKSEFSADVAFIGSYHPYKAINLNPYILEMQELRIKDRPLKLRYYSSWHVPSVFYAGAIDKKLNKDALKSATVLINVSEPHSTAFGTDCIERIFYSQLEGFLISDYVKRAHSMFHDTCLFAKDPQEFHELVLHYVKYPEERTHFMKKSREKILGGHTYFDRVADLMGHVGLENNVLEKKAEFLNAHNSL